jgi:hypothetical protein
MRFRNIFQQFFSLEFPEDISVQLIPFPMIHFPHLKKLRYSNENFLRIVSLKATNLKIYKGSCLLILK